MIYSAGFDVYASYFCVVVSSEDGEFDCASPCIGLCDGVDVIRWGHASGSSVWDANYGKIGPTQELPRCIC